MIQKRVFILVSYILLFILAIYLILFRIEGFAYSCTCTKDSESVAPGSASAPAPAPAPAQVDISTFLRKPVPSGGCPGGLISANWGPNGKVCLCPGLEQVIENNKCACPAGSTFTPFPNNEKWQGADGFCTCNEGTYAPPNDTRGGGGGAPPAPLKCITQCPSESNPVKIDMGGVMVPVCSRGGR
jgi:hypothetical protein